MGVGYVDESFQCPCCVECNQCKDFHKVAEIKDAGLVIFRHLVNNDDVDKQTEVFQSAVSPAEDVFIFQNTRNVDLPPANFVPTLETFKISCLRCRRMYERAQKLLQRVPIIGEKHVVGICDHCYQKQFPKTCNECDKVVNKFLSVRYGERDPKDALKTWLSKMKHALRNVTGDDENTVKGTSRAKSDLYIDKPHQLETRTLESHKEKVLVIPEMRRSETNIPGSFQYNPTHDERGGIKERLQAINKSDRFLQSQQKYRPDQQHINEALEAARREQSGFGARLENPSEILRQMRESNIPGSLFNETKQDKDGYNREPIREPLHSIGKSFGFLNSSRAQNMLPADRAHTGEALGIGKPVHGGFGAHDRHSVFDRPGRTTDMDHMRDANIPSSHLFKSKHSKDVNIQGYMNIPDKYSEHLDPVKGQKARQADQRRTVENYEVDKPAYGGLGTREPRSLFDEPDRINKIKKLHDSNISTPELNKSKYSKDKKYEKLTHEFGKSVDLKDSIKPRKRHRPDQKYSSESVEANKKKPLAFDDSSGSLLLDEDSSIRPILDKVPNKTSTLKRRKEVSKERSETLGIPDKQGLRIADQQTTKSIIKKTVPISTRERKHVSKETIVSTISKAAQNTLGKELSYFFPVGGETSKKPQKLKNIATSAALIQDTQKKIEEENLRKEAEKKVEQVKKKKLAEEKAKLIAEKQRLAEEKKKMAADNENKRKAEEDEKNKQSEEKKRIAEDEKKKQSEEKKRIAEDEKKKQSEEKKRIAEDGKNKQSDEKKRITEDEKKKQSEEKKRIAEDEKKKQSEEKKRIAEDEKMKDAEEKDKKKRTKEDEKSLNIPKSKIINNARDTGNTERDKEKMGHYEKDATSSTLKNKLKSDMSQGDLEKHKETKLSSKDKTSDKEKNENENIEQDKSKTGNAQNDQERERLRKQKEEQLRTEKADKQKEKEVKETEKYKDKEEKKLKAIEKNKLQIDDKKGSESTKYIQDTDPKPKHKSEKELKGKKEAVDEADEKKINSKDKHVSNAKSTNKEDDHPKQKNIQGSDKKGFQSKDDRENEPKSQVKRENKRDGLKRASDENNIQEQDNIDSKRKTSKDVKNTPNENENKDILTMQQIMARKEQPEQAKNKDTDRNKQPTDSAKTKEAEGNKQKNKDDTKFNTNDIKKEQKAQSAGTAETPKTGQKSEAAKLKEAKNDKNAPEDLILQLVKSKQEEPDQDKVAARNIDPLVIIEHNKHCQDAFSRPPCIICLNSDLELDIESVQLEKLKRKLSDIIIGEKIFKFIPPPDWQKKEEQGVIPSLLQPVLSMTLDSGSVTKPRKEMSSKQAPPAELVHATVKSAKLPPDPELTKGIMRYALSDRTFIDKGWTMLPTEKVVRKMNVYRMRPAQPQFDWFEHNKNKRLMLYDSGERLAEFDDNGRGRWYYKNGHLALDYYDAEEINANQRFVLYSSGEPDERGRSQPITILATFDYLGNGVVFDHSGKIRLKYNQTEGVVLDRGIGPVSHWKWHTLNDPPVLQQVMIDTQMAHKDPQILKLGASSEKKPRPDNDEMLAIEFDNFIEEKSRKLTQSFKPFQIKMKALKINEHFSLKVLDQATVYLIYRDGATNLKINIGMILDHKEIVDTDTAEVGEVSNSLERFPARTGSLAGMQRSVAYAQRFERARTERERRLRPAEPTSSADRLTAGVARPLRPPLRTGPADTACYCNIRKPSCTLYYNTRLT